MTQYDDHREKAGRPRIVDWLLAFYLVVMLGLQAGPYHYVSQLVAVPGVLLAMLSLRFRIRSFDPLVFFTVLFVGWAYVAASASSHSEQALDSAGFICQIYTVALLLRWRSMHAKNGYLFVWALCAGAVLAGVFGWASSWEVLAAGGSRTGGFATNENALSAVLLQGGFAALLLAVSGSRRGRVTGMAYALIATPALLAAGSRQVVVVIIAVAVTYGLVGNTHRIARYATRVVAVGVFLALAMLFVSRNMPNSPLVQRVTKTIEGQAVGTGQSRWYLAARGWEIYLDHPVCGVGFGTIDQYMRGASYTHSTYTELLACGGTPAFAIYVGLLLSLGLSFGALRVPIGKSRAAFPRAAGLAILVGVMTHGAFALVHQSKGAIFLLFVLSGLAKAGGDAGEGSATNRISRQQKGK